MIAAGYWPQKYPSDRRCGLNVNADTAMITLPPWLQLQRNYWHYCRAAMATNRILLQRSLDCNQELGIDLSLHSRIVLAAIRGPSDSIVSQDTRGLDFFELAR